MRRLRTLVDASWTRRAQADESEAGFTLVELVVALMLITIVSTGLMVSVGLGFRTVAVARQRETASELASQNLEQLGNFAYDKLYLNNYPSPPAPAADADPPPAPSPDPANPDYYVSTGGSTGLQYDVTGQGQKEDVIVGAVGDHASASHLVDPYQVGSTVMRIYVYITWVNDPSAGGAHAYKRGTVVVQYHAPAANGVNQFVRASAFFAKDSVTFTPPTSPPTTAVPVTTTTAAPTTTTTTPSICPGDTQAPTGAFTIGVPSSAQAGYTPTKNVTLNLSFSDTCAPIVANFSNDGATFSPDVVYDPLNAQISWTLSSGDGSKTVYGRVRDGAGNSRTLTAQVVWLDTTKPTTPASLTGTCTASGGNANVSLVWTSSADANFVGYRVYRSTDGTTWQQVLITTLLVGSDSTNKPNGNSSLRYYVVGYDKAGNESNASTIVSFSNKDC